MGYRPFKMKGFSPFTRTEEKPKIASDTTVSRDARVRMSNPPQYEVKIDGKTAWLSEKDYKAWHKRTYPKTTNKLIKRGS